MPVTTRLDSTANSVAAVDFLPDGAVTLAHVLRDLAQTLHGLKAALESWNRPRVAPWPIALMNWPTPSGCLDARSNENGAPVDSPCPICILERHPFGVPKQYPVGSIPRRGGADEHPDL